MAQPDFWDNQEKAQKLISENNVLLSLIHI